MDRCSRTQDFKTVSLQCFILNLSLATGVPLLSAHGCPPEEGATRIYLLLRIQQRVQR